MSYNATWLEYFFATIERIKQPESLSVMKLVEELQDLNISREPAQNMETFGNKVLEKENIIDGTVLAPKNLVSLFTTCFLGYIISQLEMVVLQCHDNENEEVFSIMGCNSKFLE